MNGTITKRPTKSASPSWGYSFFAGRSDTGKRIQVTKSGFATKREAADALRKAIAEHQSGPIAPTLEKSFAEFFADWLVNDVGRRCQPKTLERYRELGEYALRHIGTLPLVKVTPMALQIAINNLQDCGGRKTVEHPNGRPLAPKTVREVAFLIHNAMETAVSWKLVSDNPMDALRRKLPKAPKREVPVLSRDKLKHLLGAASPRMRPLLILAAATGSPTR